MKTELEKKNNCKKKTTNYSIHLATSSTRTDNDRTNVVYVDEYETGDFAIHSQLNLIKSSCDHTAW